MGEEQRAGAGPGRLQVEREARPGGLQQQPGVLQSQEGRRGTLQMHRGPRSLRHVPRRRSQRTSVYSRPSLLVICNIVESLLETQL